MMKKYIQEKYRKLTNFLLDTHEKMVMRTANAVTDTLDYLFERVDYFFIPIATLTLGCFFILCVLIVLWLGNNVPWVEFIFGKQLIPVTPPSAEVLALNALVFEDLYEHLLRNPDFLKQVTFIDSLKGEGYTKKMLFPYFTEYLERIIITSMNSETGQYCVEFYNLNYEKYIYYYIEQLRIAGEEGLLYPHKDFKPIINKICHVVDATYKQYTISPWRR